MIDEGGRDRKSEYIDCAITIVAVALIATFATLATMIPLWLLASWIGLT